MDCRMSLAVFAVAALCTLCTGDPSPQYFQVPFPGHHQTASPSHHDWPQTLANNSAPASAPGFLDPLAAPAEEIVKNDFPRQAYIPPNPGFQQPPRYRDPSGFSQYPGFGGPQTPDYSQRANFPPPNSFPPPSQNTGYPQIYKLDNLIIIANPPPSCPGKLDNNQFPKVDLGMIDNRFGNNEEPSKCAWAVIACCSPTSTQVRYNCFELLGCQGYFLDGGPCQPDIVMAAADAALKFYNGGSNSSRSDNNNV